MHWLVKRVALALWLMIFSDAAMAADLDQLYSSVTVVSGQGEENRYQGFRDCLDRVIVRVSGDQRLARRPELETLRTRADRFVKSFSYRDRLAEKPIHDEQGTYDRPHNLTCQFGPEVIDLLLMGMGSRPWREKRPSLAVFLDIQRNGPRFPILANEPRDAAMRQSFAMSAEAMAMQVIFPSSAGLDAWALGPSAPEIAQAARGAGADLPLVGKLIWSDPDFGWTATWRLTIGEKEHSWSVRGVNFDEAFRVAIRGAAQILSNNGLP